ncbi:MAG: ABC transporter permease [Verrucomicrobia bacterium]|nr:ABC transporter permease [Verrucomicrobiota bacterium]
MSHFRLALRQLLKSPGFSATAIATLAIAIAVNAAVFAVLRVVVYAPVSKSEPEQVTGLFPNRPTARGHDYRRVSYAEYQAVRRATDLFRDVAAMSPAMVGVGEGLEAKRSLALLVSSNFFAFHGVSAELRGRGFSEAEGRPGAAQNVAVASYDYWQRQGGKPDFLGSQLRIGGRTFTVVGIAPRGFSGLNVLIGPDLYFPLGCYRQLSGGLPGEQATPQELTEPSEFALNVWVRLAPGLTRETATLRLPDLAQRVREFAPPQGEEARQEPRRWELGPQSRYGISDGPEGGGVTVSLGVVLQGMAVLVLVVASLNLANLLLARGAVRKREVAVRLALGATRGHIVRQLLAEGAVLAFLGGLAGLWLGCLGMDWLIASVSQSVAPAWGFSLAFSATPDFGVSLAVATLCGGATLLFSLGPALSLSKRDLSLDIRTGAAAEGTQRRGWLGLFGTRQLLVTVQLALALALLFTAVQFFRGGLGMAKQSPGFRTDGVAVLEVDYRFARLPREEAPARFRALAAQLETLPGVVSAQWSTLVPFDNTDIYRRAEGLGPHATEPPPGKARGASGLCTAIEAGYFQQLGISLLGGREFSAAETAPGSQAQVAIVDEGLARRLFQDGVALGRRIKVAEGERVGEFEVVGVVRSPWHGFTGAAEPPARVYLPFPPEAGLGAYLTVKFQAGERGALTAAVQHLRREILARDRAAQVVQALPLQEFVDRNANFWVIRSTAVLFGLFATVALILAVVGVYGVAAYLVARRTRELGLRMALGSTAGQVLALVLGQSARQALLAVAVGGLLAVGLATVLRSELSLLPPVDALGLTACGLVLFSAAVAAGLPPARRAARIEPSEALRSE